MSETSPRANEDWLVHQWVAAGLVSAAARFVPIPFVDDVIHDRCRRFVVSKTLAAHGRSAQLDELEPYFAGNTRGLSGCVVSAVKAPLKLLLFPIRKVATIVTSIRGVPMEVTRTILLGRTLDRRLDRGDVMTADHAVAMRKAFERSFRHIDFRVVRAAVKDALASVNQWKSAAKSDATRTYQRDGSTEEINHSPKIDEGAHQVQQALDRPEVMELFARFDARFDQAMQS